MLYGTALAASDPRMTWAVGVFRDTPDDGDIRDDGGYNVTGRLTWLPWYKEGGTSLVHLGAAYSLRNPNDHTASFDSRPEAHLVDRFVDTGSFMSDDVDLIGLEAACVSGPFSVQGEYVFANVDVASSANFQGYYAQASYFLTGEHRRYKPSEGVFSRVKPNENFKYGGGPGAWEVALRYSGLDLDDNIITGGKLHDITAGLNWYLNPNMRIMWNYVHADKDHIGNADMIMMRLQVDF
jgi:phosphate-selective porin OprO/OprP